MIKTTKMEINLAEEFNTINHNDPYMWFTKAKELRYSANILFKDYERNMKQWEDYVKSEPTEQKHFIFSQRRQWIMLLHFMMENLAKGYAIINKGYLSIDGNLHSKLNHHSITSLLPNNQIVPNNFLEFTKDIAEGTGRYPVTNKADKVKENIKFNPYEIRELAEKFYRYYSTEIIKIIIKDAQTIRQMTVDEYIESELNANP